MGKAILSIVLPLVAVQGLLGCGRQPSPVVSDDPLDLAMELDITSSRIRSGHLSPSDTEVLRKAAASDEVRLRGRSIVFTGSAASKNLLDTAKVGAILLSGAETASPRETTTRLMVIAESIELPVKNQHLTSATFLLGDAVSGKARSAAFRGLLLASVKTEVDSCRLAVALACAHQPTDAEVRIALAENRKRWQGNGKLLEFWQFSLDLIEVRKRASSR